MESWDDSKICVSRAAFWKLLACVFFVTMVSVYVYSLYYLSKDNKEMDDDINSFKYEVGMKMLNLSESVNSNKENIEDSFSDIHEIGLEMAGLNTDVDNPSDMLTRTCEAVVRVEAGEMFGTGFFISDRYIVTNWHIVEIEGARVNVFVHSGEEIRAEVIGVDIKLDVAVLDMGDNYHSTRWLEFRDSNNLIIGERVFAIGNAMGMDDSISAGIISGLNRELIDGEESYIQTDADFHPGNSGGPLIDKEGLVVGLNTFKAVGQGFALQSRELTEVINNIFIFEERDSRVSIIES